MCKKLKKIIQQEAKNRQLTYLETILIHMSDLATNVLHFYSELKIEEFTQRSNTYYSAPVEIRLKT